MTTPCTTWESWAPPLDPPTTGGLDAAEAQCIADAWWAYDAHLCAALQWEAYAATLPPSPVVSQVSTGAQSVSYSPAAATGTYGLAIQRANWHRSFVIGQVAGVPMTLAPPPIAPLRTQAWAELEPIPAGPVASFTWTPAQPAPGQVIQFDATSSTGSSGAAIVVYEWTFGTEPTASLGATPTWTPPGAGSYLVSLVVRDELSLWGSTEATVVVA